MDKIKRIEEFNRLWDIDIRPSRHFKAFRNRILYALDTVIGDQLRINPDMTRAYLSQIGEKAPIKSMSLARTKYKPYESFDEHPVYITISKAKNERELAFYLQKILWILHDFPWGWVYKEKLYTEINVAIAMTEDIKIGFANQEKSVNLYPNISPVHDKQSKDEMLQWLYPFKPVYEKYEKSVSLLRKNNPSDYRDIVDNARYALELLMKEILENDKPLEKQNDYLGKYLEERNIHTELRSLFCQTVNYFVKYNNDWAKHPDKKGYHPSLSEVEFIVYQTGTIMRLLTQLEDERKRKEITDKATGKE